MLKTARLVRRTLQICISLENERQSTSWRSRRSSRRPASMPAAAQPMMRTGSRGFGVVVQDVTEMETHMALAQPAAPTEIASPDGRREDSGFDPCWLLEVRTFIADLHVGDQAGVAVCAACAARRPVDAPRPAGHRLRKSPRADTGAAHGDDPQPRARNADDPRVCPKPSAVPIFRRMLASRERAHGTVRQRGEPAGQIATVHDGRNEHREECRRR
jgi:hypothetical protein